LAIFHRHLSYDAHLNPGQTHLKKSQLNIMLPKELSPHNLSLCLYD